MARKQLGTNPLANQDVATKKYVDDTVASGGGGSGTTISSLTYIGTSDLMPDDLTPVVDSSASATKKTTLLDAAETYASWTAGLNIFMSQRIFVP